MKKENVVSVPFMVLGIVFCVCLVAANLLETKVIQLGTISVTAGLISASYYLDGLSDELHGCGDGTACRSLACRPVLGRRRVV